MYPSIDGRKKIEHAIREFAQGVAFMHEEGNSSDVAAVMERLIAALDSQARAHAAATVKPRMPGWAVTFIVALAVSFLGMTVNGLMNFAALQTRVSSLENAHPEVISSLTTEVHFVAKQVEELNQRVEALRQREVRK